MFGPTFAPQPPAIRVLGDRNCPHNITEDDYIEIVSDISTRERQIYFTSDGTIPNHERRYVDGHEKTFKFKGPFKLCPGRRTVKAIVVSRIHPSASEVVTATFTVTPTDISDDLLSAFSDGVTTTLVTDSSVSGSPLFLAPAHPARRRWQASSDLDYFGTEQEINNYFTPIPRTEPIYAKGYRDSDRFRDNFQISPGYEGNNLPYSLYPGEKLRSEQNDRARRKSTGSDSAESSAESSGHNSGDKRPHAPPRARGTRDGVGPAQTPKAVVAPVTERVALRRGLNEPKQAQSNKLAPKKPGLNFVNDSGTQINIWGRPPDDLMEQIRNASAGRGVAFLGPAQGSARQVTTSREPIRDRQLRQREKIGRVQSNAQQLAPGGAAVDGPVSMATSQRLESEVHWPWSHRNGSKDERNVPQGEGLSGPRGGKTGKPGADPLPPQISASGFAQIRAKCLQQRVLWEDPDFPASDKSIFRGQRPDFMPVDWKRPHEIFKDPKLIVGDASRFDVMQGVLGNCWLLAAVAALTTNPKLVDVVIPKDQNFQDLYAGVFHFNVWQYGYWVDVCVDDRLPTKNGKLVFMSSRDQGEFWSPLLEKAYAKLNGTYEALDGGITSEAMTDFTGGLCEAFNLPERVPPDMFKILLKARERGSLMGCSIDAPPNRRQDKLRNGLIIGHAYTVTDVRTIHLESRGGASSIELVRVRNPWGNEAEWNGPWSDKSREWNSISEGDKKDLGLTFASDGEFWMSSSDFFTNYHRVEICHLNPNEEMNELGRRTEMGQEDAKRWSCNLQEGSWRRKVNAGGCRNYPATFWTNPQYRVTLTDVDDDDDENIGTLIVALMQKNRRKLQGSSNLAIGYEIYQVDASIGKTGVLGREFFERNRAAATSPKYVDSREVCNRHKLPPGEYCIVPTTYEPNQEADFVLRIFTEKEHSLNEMSEATAVTSVMPDEAVPPVPASRADEALATEADRQFARVCGDNREVDAYELQTILNDVFRKNFQFEGFDINLCRSLVALANMDRIGHVNLEEFRALWDQLQAWKAIFMAYDSEKKGYFYSFELRDALKKAGFTLSNQTFNVAVVRFSDKDGFIRLDDFIACLVKMKIMFDTFGARSTKQIWTTGAGEEDQIATFHLDDFIQMTIYS